MHINKTLILLAFASKDTQLFEALETTQQWTMNAFQVLQQTVIGWTLSRSCVFIEKPSTERTETNTGKGEKINSKPNMSMENIILFLFVLE